MSRAGIDVTKAVFRAITGAANIRLTQFRGTLRTSGGVMPGPVAHTRFPQYLPVIRQALNQRLSDFEFRQEEHILAIPNPITGEDDQTIVYLDPGPRGRLLQMLETCPPGSYGSYMLPVFRAAKFVVGEFSAAEIDKVFGNLYDQLCEPFTKDLAQRLGVAETAYWRSMEGIEWLAGRLLDADSRAFLVELSGKIIQLKAAMKTWWDPTSKE